MIPPVRTDPVCGRAQSSPVPLEGRTGLGPRLEVLDWTGLVWTDPFMHIILSLLFTKFYRKYDSSSLFIATHPRIPTLIEIIPLLSVYSAPLRYIFPIKRLITGKVYPNPGHHDGSVRTKPSPVCQHLGSVRSQSKIFLGLDLDWTGRFRSGLIHCWTGGIIGDASGRWGRNVGLNINEYFGMVTSFCDLVSSFYLCSEISAIPSRIGRGLHPFLQRCHPDN